MSWLLPKPALPSGKARTVAALDPKEAANARSKKWRMSPRGRAWLKRTKKARSQRFLRYYHENAERLRPYLAKKNREYRAARRAAAMQA